MVFLLFALLAGSAGGALTVAFLYPQIASALSIFNIKPELPPAQADGQREFGTFAQLDGLIINPRDTGGQSVLAVSIGLEGSASDFEEAVAAKQLVIQDTLIHILSLRNHADLASIEARWALKQELITAVNEILYEPKARRLYFSRYILQ